MLTSDGNDRRLLSETDVRLLLLTGGVVVGCLLGFVMGLLSGHV